MTHLKRRLIGIEQEFYSIFLVVKRKDIFIYSFLMPSFKYTLRKFQFNPNNNLTKFLFILFYLKILTKKHNPLESFKPIKKNIIFLVFFSSKIKEIILKNKNKSFILNLKHDFKFRLVI